MNNNLELDFFYDRDVKHIARRVVGFLQQDPAKASSTAVVFHVSDESVPGGGHFRYQGWTGDNRLKLTELADRIALYIARHVDGRGGIEYRGATVSFG